MVFFFFNYFLKGFPRSYIMFVNVCFLQNVFLFCYFMLFHVLFSLNVFFVFIFVVFPS